MPPKTSLWPLEPHTQGKHRVLKSYLDAWLPIMGSWNGRILFIDGFAGPGEYEGGEEGSPLIALRSLKDHHARGMITAEVVYLFIEKDNKRYKHLDSLVKQQSNLPQNCRVDVVHGAYDERMTEVLDDVETQRRRLAPCFVMVDPFGTSGTPMRLITRILQNQRSEVYISFMYESINRFAGTPEFKRHLDELFGCEDWRQGLDIPDGETRRDFFYELYERQLREAGAEHVVHFDLFEGKRLVYAIFFGTHHIKGSDRMKEAIWKVAPFGDFAFRGTKSPQLTLGMQPDFEPLKISLHNRFGHKSWVSIKEVEDFVASDKTDYYTSQLRQGALIPMEEAREIEVDERTRKKRRSYPEGTCISFI